MSCGDPQPVYGATTATFNATAPLTITAEEFTQWLRGYLDAIDGAPSAVQHTRIAAELARVAAKSFVDWSQYLRPAAIPTYPVPDVGWPVPFPGTWCGELQFGIGGVCCNGGIQ